MSGFDLIVYTFCVAFVSQLRSKLLKSTSRIERAYVRRIVSSWLGRNRSHGRRQLFRRLREEALEQRCMLAVITVDTLMDESDGLIDDGDVSLRDAIAVAAMGDTIEFDPGLDGGTILLTLGELQITTDMTIDALALAQGLTIDATGNDPTPNDNLGDGSRVFSIRAIATLSGLRLTGGDVRSAGGAAHVYGAVTIVQSTITGNSSGDVGGGIYASGDVTLTRSTISANSSGSDGGGVYGCSNVMLTQSTVNDNTSDHDGGGIFACGEVTLMRSTISGNTSTTTAGGIFGVSAVTLTQSTVSGNASSDAGGVFAVGKVTLTQSTVHGNRSAADAGGLFSFGDVEVVQSTISGNTAGEFGGGVFAAYGTVTVTFSTITDNSSSLSGGGIRSSRLILDGSIVASNLTDADSGADFDADLARPPRFSLIGNNAGTGLTEAHEPDANGNVVGDPSGMGIVDPLLSPLGDYGGGTQTHTLLPGSLASNAGDPDFMAPPDFDQRGSPFLRVSGGRADMGALEVQFEPADFNGDGILNCADVDALVARIVAGDNPAQFDLTSDTVVDQADLNVWLTLAGAENQPYQPGDANLDGAVDATDFNVWQQHQFMETAAWCSADFNADGVTDATDFNIWNENRFTAPEAAAIPAASRIPRSALPRAPVAMPTYYQESGPHSLPGVQDRESTIYPPPDALPFSSRRWAFELQPQNAARESFHHIIDIALTDLTGDGDHHDSVVSYVPA